MLIGWITNWRRARTRRPPEKEEDTQQFRIRGLASPEPAMTVPEAEAAVREYLRALADLHRSIRRGNV